MPGAAVTLHALLRATGRGAQLRLQQAERLWQAGKASLEGLLLEEVRAFHAKGMGSVKALRQQQTSVMLKDREAATTAEGELLGVRWVSQQTLSGWAPPELPRTWGVPQADKQLQGFKQTADMALALGRVDLANEQMPQPLRRLPVTGQLEKRNPGGLQVCS